MKVNYTQRSQLVRYVCTSLPHQGLPSLCQSFGAIRLERAFAQLFLEALAPLGMDALLEATETHRQDRERQRELWQQQLERARYEVDLARRQYDAVDPANRLVAAELERLIRDSKRKVFLILDNLRVHHSRQVNAWLADKQDQIELFFLPSYSPELNPDESLNADLKARMNQAEPVRNAEYLRRKVISHLRSIQK